MPGAAAKQILSPALLLGLFTITATGMLALTHERTREPIAAAERAALLRSLNALVPEHDHDNDLLSDTVELGPQPGLGTRAPSAVYRARRNGRVQTVVLTAVTANGYNGEIRLLIAIHRDGRIGGVRVIGHRETPGLGDAIEVERSPWIHGFDGRSLGDPEAARWEVKKDGGAFDQLTGATITPRAVVRAVRDSLAFFAMARERLLDGPAGDYATMEPSP